MTTKGTTNQIGSYLNLKRAKLTEDRKALVHALERLAEEAEMFKRQVEGGSIYNANLTDRGRKVDELAESIRHTGDTVALLEMLQQDQEA